LAAVLAPLREPRFVRLVGVRGVSQLGDWITTAAAVTWLYDRTDATWPVSCYLGARITASLLGGLIGHRFAGGPGRERFGVLFGLRGALTAGALLAAASGATVLPISLLVLSAVVAPITNAGTAALTPSTVADDVLHQANALSGLVLEFAVVAGAAVGGVLEMPFGLSLPLGVDAATFALAAVAFSQPALRPGVRVGGAEEPTRPATFTQLAAWLMHHRAARPLLLSFAVATAAVGMLNASLPRFLTHLNASGGYGAALACIGGGAMLAGLLAGSINESRAIHRSVFLGFLGMAGAVALLAYSTVPATAFLILVLIGILDATTEVSYSTIIQRAFPTRHLTAIMTVASAFISGGMVIGFAAAAAGEQFAPQASLLLPAAGCGLAALLAVPLAWRRRTAAGPESPPTTLARGLLQLPVLLETATGRTVAVVAEEHGRWLAYPADAIREDADLRLRLAGFELAARPVASAGHHGAWIEVTEVNRVRRAA
jgi:MFS family permease